MRLICQAGVCVLVFALQGCSPHNHFADALVSAASKGPGSVVAFRELTEFQWDTVYVYGPYHPLSAVDARHGTDLRRGEIGSHVPEGQCLYVFREADTIVATLYGPRYCANILNPGTYSRAGAAFMVQGKGPHWQLVPLVDNPCEP